MVVEKNQYRSVEHIKTKVTQYGGFENYINSLQTTTKRNYKKFLKEYVVMYENSNKKYLELIDNKKIKNSNNELNENIDSIIKRINDNSKDSDFINIFEDLEFLMYLILVDETNKEKSKLTKSDISFKLNNNTIEVYIYDEQKYILTKYIELFSKAFKSLSVLNSSLLFKGNSFNKLMENQFLNSGLEYKRDLKNFRETVKIHIVKKSIKDGQ